MIPVIGYSIYKIISYDWKDWRKDSENMKDDIW